MSLKLSATIITLNEELNMARAIESLKSFCDEIIILDSNSTDRTCEIANNLGAKVIQNRFEGFGQQKNAASAKAKGEWILNIDADEEVTEELRQSILKVISTWKSGGTFPELYEINRLTQFCGKWIYHGGWYPDYQTRLCRKNSSFWTEPKLHERLILNKKEGSKSAAIGRLHGHLHHYSFPTVHSQVFTNIKYARLGSQQFLKTKGRRSTFLELIFRPAWKFIECYFLKKGFIDGIEGLIIAINASYSLFMKYSFSYKCKTPEE